MPEIQNESKNEVYIRVYIYTVTSYKEIFIL